MEIGSLARYDPVTVGPTHSLVEAAKWMAEHNAGAAIVLGQDAPGIISERDLLRAIADGADFERTRVEDYMTWNAVVAAPTWDVETAARTMLERGFRHLIVAAGDDLGAEVGMLSIRDLARALFGGRPVGR